MHVIQDRTVHCISPTSKIAHTQCHHLVVVAAVVGIIRDIPDLSPVSAPPPTLPLPERARTACCRSPLLLLHLLLLSAKVTTLRPVPATFLILPLPLLQVSEGAG